LLRRFPSDEHPAIRFERELREKEAARLRALGCVE
jgi:hypothetical protein